MFGGEPVYALVVAAGRSTRMQGQDKIFAPLAGVPLLARTVDVFLRSPQVDEIIVTLHEECLDAGRRLAVERQWRRVRFCSGGPRRQDSVRLGLEQFTGDGWVLIHDGARPLISTALIARGLEAAAVTGAAVPGVPVTDTIKMASTSGMVERTLPRVHLRAIQTPQVFRLSLIRSAHLAGLDQTFTDDSALLEALGHPVAVFPGDPDNLKITTPADHRWAEQRWRELEKDDV